LVAAVTWGSPARSALMRKRDFAAAVVMTLASSAAAMAGWREFYHQSKIDYRRSKEWPYPFVCADRMATRTPLAMQVDNGWRRQNTLGTEMFSIETGELTQAETHKVRWIVTQAPVQRRTVWVLRADTQ